MAETNGHANGGDIPHSNWTKEQLMGTDLASSTAKMTIQNGGKKDPLLWGRPGHLTEAEANTFFRFKEQVDKRGGDFRDTVYGFGIEEGEVYALCRWLRARKFVYDDVIKMVEEATKVMAQPKANGFYPDPSKALGCDLAIYQAQYPQVYCGYAKNGSPVFFSKTGILNTDAVECITTVGNIVKFHWYVQVLDFGSRLRAHKKEDPSFTNFDSMTILDMEHLTIGQLGQRTMQIIKEQSTLDSLCFPETMNKMFIINSPRFFTATWKIIKGYIDARTAAKVEVLSDRTTWEKVLLDYIDADQLPKDYGGKAPTTTETMEKDGFTGGLKRLHTEVLSLRSSASTTFNLFPGEQLDVTVYTRSQTGAKFTMTDAHNAGKKWAAGIPVQNNHGDSEKLPTHKSLLYEGKIQGPAVVKVDAESMGSRFKTSASNYLVVFSVY